MLLLLMENYRSSLHARECIQIEFKCSHSVLMVLY